MKAMIFAAGLGTRLKPLTDNKPKALVEVGGKTMLELVILKLKEAGFNEIVINIHHFGQQIIDYLKANNNFGLTIHISDERDYLLDTGGGIKKATPFLMGNEPFLVHNVDIFSNVDLRQLYENHLKSGATATLLVSQRKTARYLLFNKENKLCGWHNNETGEVKSFYSAASTSSLPNCSTSWMSGPASSRSSTFTSRSAPAPTFGPTRKRA